MPMAVGRLLTTLSSHFPPSGAIVGRQTRATFILAVGRHQQAHMNPNSPIRREIIAMQAQTAHIGAKVRHTANCQFPEIGKLAIFGAPLSRALPAARQIRPRHTLLDHGDNIGLKLADPGIVCRCHRNMELVLTWPQPQRAGPGRARP